MKRILLVEDDHEIRNMLRLFLSQQNYHVEEAADGHAALKTIRKHSIDLVVLDWMLPDISGPEILQSLRAHEVTRDLPVLMLSARAQEGNKVEGLDSGADDYMTKPVSLKELSARIKALLRRSQKTDLDERLTKGAISLDLESYTLYIRGKQVKCGMTEFRLLHYFLKTVGRVHTREQLLDQVWGQGVFIEIRTVDVHILRLRKILKSQGLDKALVTVRGVGYQFNIKDE